MGKTRWEKCPKCKLEVNLEAVDKCPECGYKFGILHKLKKSSKGLGSRLKKVEKPEKEEGEEEPEREEPEKEEKKEKPTKKGLILRIIILIGVSIFGIFLTVTGAISKWFPGVNTAIIIAIVTLIVAIILGSFYPDPYKGKFTLGLTWLGLFLFFMFVFFPGEWQEFWMLAYGTTEKYATKTSKYWDAAMCCANTFVESGECDPNCWEIEEEEREVKKIGKWKNLELEYGRKVGDKTFKNKVPETGKMYNFDIILINENKEKFAIEIEDVNVYAEDGINPPDKAKGTTRRHFPYNLQPKEDDFTVRFEWWPFPDCDGPSVTFKINVTSIQKSGSGSCKYGLAPEEEGHVNYLHYFDPEIETNPGPLDIYVFTDPYAVNFEWYDNFSVIINIENKVDGIAFLDNITLIQTFEFTDKNFFEITKCYDDEGKELDKNNYVSDECGVGDNCIWFDFLSFLNYGGQLNITKDESREIICNADITNRDLTGTYTDYISVFTSSYRFLQEFEKSKKAECEATTTTISATTTTSSTTAPGVD